MRYEESAGAVIFYLEGKEPRFLLLKYPTYWGFAKGLIERGESVEQTAIREVEEETGFKDLKLIPGFTFMQEWFYKFNDELIKKKATFFLAQVDKKDAENVKLSSEHEAFEWLSYDDAIKTMKVKNNKDMIAKAYEFIKGDTKQKKLF